MLTPYRLAAKAALQKYNGLSESEALERAENDTYEGLENDSHAESSVKAGCKAIWKAVGGDEKDYPAFESMVLGKNNAELTVEQQLILMEMGQLLATSPSKEQDVLKVLESIHNEWVKDYPEKFKDLKRLGKKFQHLPMELIGWEQVEIDYMFLKPLLTSMGYNVDSHDLKMAWRQRAIKYANEHDFVKADGSIDEKKLAKHIYSLGEVDESGVKKYPPLSDENTPTKQDAILMAGQVVEHIGVRLERSKEI